MYLQGGFKTQTVVQIGNVLAAYNDGRISLRGLRTYFAAASAAAVREAAARSRKRGSRSQRRCSYQATELARLCRCTAEGIKRELRRLERAGLLLFSETEIVFTTQPLPGSHDVIGELAGGRSPFRPVPLPRPAIRFIARCSKVATIKTMLAYCVRGLTISRDGLVTGTGTAKASWIAETCGLSLRAVRVARAELIDAGFITRDESSTQCKLNRHGAYFAINMAFREGRTAVDQLEPSGEVSAPPKAKKRPISAPPYKDLKTPCGSKNQKTRADEQSGFCEARKVREPRLADVQPEDLRSVSRMLALHTQALEAGLVQESEASRLAFLACAVHAVRVAHRNAGGLFATIVRKGLWHFATQDDEERARRCLQRWEAKRMVSVLISTARGSGCDGLKREGTCGLSPLRESSLLGSLAQARPAGGQHELEAAPGPDVLSDTATVLQPTAAEVGFSAGGCQLALNARSSSRAQS